MILLTRLSGSVFVLNADLIERLDSTPDTVVTLVDGKKYVVAESLDRGGRRRCAPTAARSSPLSAGPDDPERRRGAAPPHLGAVTGAHARSRGTEA